ncbi:MAG TPA: ABC transporter permease, partial [Candidatus Saccharimonadales bacterium]|nr:ABC transporter permease [Candidatus Saccharimonadales bacterium]
MKYRDIIATANGNLRRSKLRTFLTVSAVFMGAFTLMLTTGIGAGLKVYVAEQVGAMGAKDMLLMSASQEDAENPFGDNKPKEYDPNAEQATSAFGLGKMLQPKDLETIEKTPGIEAVIPLYSAESEYLGVGDTRFATGVDQAIDGINQPMSVGRQVAGDAKNYEVTLPPNLVKPLGFANEQAALGKAVTFGFKDSTGTIFTLDAKVVGVQQKTIINSNSPSVNVAMMRDAYTRMTAGLPTYQVAIHEAAFARFDDKLSDEQLESLKKTLQDQGYDATTLADQLGVINSVITGITTFLNVFAAIALAAGSFG